MSDWTAAAFRGTSLGVDEWRLEAELVGVRIVGGLAIAGPGALRSPVAFENTIRGVMRRADVEPAVTDAVAATIWQAWKLWADGVTIPGLPWYPAFFAWPAPVAPPMPNVPTPLIVCASATLDAMSPGRLAGSLRGRLGANAHRAGSSAAIDSFASAFHAAFMQWLAMANVMLAFGAGTAAVGPLVPVQPVHGTLVNNGRGCLAAAPRFPESPYGSAPA